VSSSADIDQFFKVYITRTHICNELNNNIIFYNYNQPAVTFPAEERHRPLTSTKLYCLVTEAYRCEQLAQGCYADGYGETQTHDLNDPKSSGLEQLVATLVGSTELLYWDG